jgi:hypothetical protein
MVATGNASTLVTPVGAEGNRPDLCFNLDIFRPPFHMREGKLKY